MPDVLHGTHGYRFGSWNVGKSGRGPDEVEVCVCVCVLCMGDMMEGWKQKDSEESCHYKFIWQRCHNGNHVVGILDSEELFEG